MDLEALASSGGNLISAVERIPAEQALALRFETAGGVNPGLRRDGLAWILEFRQQAFQVSTPIEIKPEASSPSGARVFLPVTQPGRAVLLTDPRVGDNLVAIPVIPLGHGIARARTFPEFDLLATIQGVVVRTHIDDLRVRSLRQGIELTSAGGLHISSVTSKVQADLKLGSMRPLTRVFDLEPWRSTKLATANETRQGLQRAVTGARGMQREEARMNLARFFFSIGLWAESKSVLRLVREDRPEAENEPEFRVLRGADNMFMGRLEESQADLGHDSLSNNDEGEFWRATLAAVGGDAAGAAKILKRTAGIIRPYPKALKIRLGMVLADVAVTMGDIREAKKRLELLAAEEPAPHQQAQVDFIVGRLLEISGNFDNAILKWEDVEAGPHRPSRAAAAVARTELQLKLNHISPAEAAQEMEKLRFAWRGDAFEFRLLRRLGELYLADGDYRNGLRTLRQAVTHFRTHEERPQINKLMAETFLDLYLGEKADTLAPVTAIALYQEFKELVPAGDKNDQMVRKLADRLIAVDLLDDGARLLEDQVKFRLKGVEKARVGTRLGLVYLMSREPEKALAALEASSAPDLPEDLVNQRRYVTARAFQTLGRRNEAVALLKEDKSLDADMLRLENFWEEQDWPNAASILGRVLEASGVEKGKALDETQGRYVLNMAVALTLSGNQRAINRLRRDHGEAMDASVYKDAFRLIAGDQTQGLTDYRTIAGKVAVAESFQGFMAAYKKRLKAQNLSDIN